MSAVPRTETVTLINGEYVVSDSEADIRSRPSVTFDSVHYGALTGINSTVAIVVLTYHSGGTATWRYVYLFDTDSSRPRLLAWLRAGSRADQGLRAVSATDGDLVLVVNDPDRRQGDCCSAGTITTRYRWLRDSFSAVGKPVYRTDPPSFDCRKAATPIEQMTCHDAELSFLDRQMANSYKEVLKGASAERKEIIRQQQAEWFAEYRRTCNAPLSDSQRRDCIDQHLNERLMTIWK
ncbi:MAG TPA: lysozyme inhibitor LprI family protein [Terracidiphilus sp.]|nr:lysozyme inhibitor LprI family protein [Terracidiphilus sp.]